MRWDGDFQVDDFFFVLVGMFWTAPRPAPCGGLGRGAGWDRSAPGRNMMVEMDGRLRLRF